MEQPPSKSTDLTWREMSAQIHHFIAQQTIVNANMSLFIAELTRDRNAKTAPTEDDIINLQAHNDINHHGECSIMDNTSNPATFSGSNDFYLHGEGPTLANQCSSNSNDANDSKQLLYSSTRSTHSNDFHLHGKGHIIFNDANESTLANGSVAKAPASGPAILSGSHYFHLHGEGPPLADQCSTNSNDANDSKQLIYSSTRSTYSNDFHLHGVGHISNDFHLHGEGHIKLNAVVNHMSNPSFSTPTRASNSNNVNAIELPYSIENLMANNDLHNANQSISQPTPPSPSQTVPHAIGPSITQPTSKRRKKRRKAHHQVDNHQPTSYPPVEDPLRPGPVPRPPPEPPPPYPPSPSRTHRSDLQHHLAVMQAQLDLPTVISLRRTTEGQLLNLSGEFTLYNRHGAKWNTIYPGSATEAIRLQLYWFERADWEAASIHAHAPELIPTLPQSFPTFGWYTLPSNLNKLPQYLNQQLITGYLHPSRPSLSPTAPTLLPPPSPLSKVLQQTHITAFFPPLQTLPTPSWPRFAMCENKLDGRGASIENEMTNHDMRTRVNKRKTTIVERALIYLLTGDKLKHTEKKNYSNMPAKYEHMSQNKRRQSRKKQDNYNERESAILTTHPHPLPLLSAWITVPLPLITQHCYTPTRATQPLSTWTAFLSPPIYTSHHQTQRPTQPHITNLCPNARVFHPSCACTPPPPSKISTLSSHAKTFFPSHTYTPQIIHLPTPAPPTPAPQPFTATSSSSSSSSFITVPSKSSPISVTPHEPLPPRNDTCHPQPASPTPCDVWDFQSDPLAEWKCSNCMHNNFFCIHETICHICNKPKHAPNPPKPPRIKYKQYGFWDDEDTPPVHRYAMYEEDLEYNKNEYNENVCSENGYNENDTQSWETVSEDSDWGSVMSHDWDYTPIAPKIPSPCPPEIHETPPIPPSLNTSLSISITACPVIIPLPTPDTTRTTIKVNFFLQPPHTPIHTHQCKGARLRKPSTIPPPQFTLTPITTHAKPSSHAPCNPLLTFITIHTRATRTLHKTLLQASHATYIHDIHNTLKQLYPEPKFIPRKHCFFSAPSYSPAESSSYFPVLYDTIVQLVRLLVFFVHYFSLFPDIRPIGVLCAGIG